MVFTTVIKPCACEFEALVIGRRPGLQPSEQMVVAQGKRVWQRSMAFAYYFVKRRAGDEL